MRRFASVQRVWKIEPIEGADRIELAHVLGWQCVVNKGQIAPMDIAVYLEIDSFLPIRPEFEFMRASSYKHSNSLGNLSIESVHRLPGGNDGLCTSCFDGIYTTSVPDDSCKSRFEYKIHEAGRRL